MGIDRKLATFAAGAMLVATIVACGGNRNEADPTVQGRASASPSPSATALSLPTQQSQPSAAAAPPHVFVIVMENTALARALSSQPIAKLASANTLLTNYRAVARPSLPNYLAMTSGSTWGVTDNDYHVLPARDLGTQLTTAGISWRAYMEGLTGAGCMRSPYPYALKHNPFAYFGGKCPANVVPIEALGADLRGNTPNLVWITPGLCNSGHDCALDVAGAWLNSTVSGILSSAAWASGGVLFITWDEGDAGDSNLVPLIVITKNATAARVEGQYDHYSLLATIQDLLGLPRLGAAVTARPLTQLIGR